MMMPRPCTRKTAAGPGHALNAPGSQDGNRDCKICLVLACVPCAVLYWLFSMRVSSTIASYLLCTGFSELSRKSCQGSAKLCYSYPSAVLSVPMAATIFLLKRPMMALFSG